MRFSMRTLLLISTFVTILVAALFSLPSFLAAWIAYFLLGALPATLACIIYFGSGNIKAFSLGALIPIVPNTLLSYLMMSPSIIVSQKVRWWITGQDAGTALDAYEIIHDSWEHIGHTALAAQTPVWIAAIFSGLCAMTARKWLLSNKETIRKLQATDKQE